MDPEQAAAAVTERTKAIICVDLAGAPVQQVTTEIFQHRRRKESSCFGLPMSGSEALGQ